MTTWDRTTPGAAASESLLSQITAQANAAIAQAAAAAASATAAASSATSAATSRTTAEASASAAATSASAAATSAIAAAASATAAAAVVAAFGTAAVTFADLVTVDGPGLLQLKPGASDHAYLEFYARTATPGTRSGYLGYSSAASVDLVLANQLAGALRFYVNGALRWDILAAGHLVPVTANAVDVGQASQAVRDIYAAAVKSTLSSGLTLWGQTGQIVQVRTNGVQRMYWDVNGHLVPNTANAYDVGSTTLPVRNVYSSGVYVDGNLVVGARGAAVANATDAASAITQLNTLLARLRAHGLIAT